MASKSEQAAQFIAKQAMKGWEPVAKPQVHRDSPFVASPDGVLPSSEDLKRKYLGSAAPSDVGVRRDSVPAIKAPDAEETETVTLESGGLRRSVGVSSKKVIWRQG